MFDTDPGIGLGTSSGPGTVLGTVTALGIGREIGPGSATLPGFVLGDRLGPGTVSGTGTAVNHRHGHAAVAACCHESKEQHLPKAERYW